MSNKNNSGIDSFLTSQKLFQREKVYYNRTPSGQKPYDGLSSSRGTPSKVYQYNILNQANRMNSQAAQTPARNEADSHSEANRIKASARTDERKNESHLEQNSIAESAPIGKVDHLTTSPAMTSRYGEETTKTPPLSKGSTLAEMAGLSKSAVRMRESQLSPAITKKQKIVRDSQFVGQVPAEEQSPSTWQSLVIKSSRKYFDSCREQAADYIAKIEDMLHKDSGYLQGELAKIRTTVEQAHAELAGEMKQFLYFVVDQSVQKWRIESLTAFRSRQIDYMGSLLQLHTQIEQRYKQTLAFRSNLQDEKSWKRIASDLLTSNYEANLVQLSKLCQKAVYLSEENVKQEIDIRFRIVEEKLKDKHYADQLSTKICRYLVAENEVLEQDLVVRTFVENEAQVVIEQNEASANKNSTPSERYVKETNYFINISPSEASLSKEEHNQVYIKNDQRIEGARQPYKKPTQGDLSQKNEQLKKAYEEHRKRYEEARQRQSHNLKKVHSFRAEQGVKSRKPSECK